MIVQLGCCWALWWFLTLATGLVAIRTEDRPYRTWELAILWTWAAVTGLVIIPAVVVVLLVALAISLVLILVLLAVWSAWASAWLVWHVVDNVLIRCGVRRADPVFRNPAFPE